MVSIDEQNKFNRTNGKARDIVKRKIGFVDAICHLCSKEKQKAVVPEQLLR